MFRRCRYTGKAVAISVVMHIVMLIIIVYLVEENTVLKIKLKTVESSVQSELQHKQSPSSANKPLAREETREEFIPSNLTILLFNEAGGDAESNFNNQLENLKKRFPLSQFLWNTKKNHNLGESLNLLITQVKTEYFLFVEPRMTLSDKPEESVNLLWKDLQQFPELDFVGGSYLSRGKLYVPCYYFRLCKWTFSESYEYERSLENLMICEGISSSFMGRTESVKKVKEGFDGNIPDILVVKDFFLRAKGNSIVAATRPGVLFLIDRYRSLYELWSSTDITKELVPFAVKHKVFLFKDIDGNVIDICSPASPLSGKGLCIEKNSHKQMLNGGHWAYDGLFTYPYLLKYLEISLSEVTKFFNQHNVSYFVGGGVSLGAIKMRSILPWEAGDVDIGVYDMTTDQLYNLFEPLRKQKGYFVRKLGNWQVQIYCTPRNIGNVSGGLVSIFPQSDKAPPRNEFIEILTNGMWISYKRDLISYLAKKYSEKFLEHKIYKTSETSSCKIKGHNACLPNFKILLGGKAGTLKTFFCEI